MVNYVLGVQLPEWPQGGPPLRWLLSEVFLQPPPSSSENMFSGTYLWALWKICHWGCCWKNLNQSLHENMTECKIVQFGNNTNTCHCDSRILFDLSVWTMVYNKRITCFTLWTRESRILHCDLGPNVALHPRTHTQARLEPVHMLAIEDVGVVLRCHLMSMPAKPN